MTKEAFDKAYILLNQEAKIKSIKEKMIREFPEFSYDKEIKEIGDELLELLNDRLDLIEREVQNL